MLATGFRAEKSTTPHWLPVLGQSPAVVLEHRATDQGNDVSEESSLRNFLVDRQYDGDGGRTNDSSKVK